MSRFNQCIPCCDGVDVLVFFGIGADRPPREAMPVAIACLEQEEIRAEKITDRRVPLPARSEYISENRGTVLEKSRRGRGIPRLFSDTAG